MTKAEIDIFTDWINRKNGIEKSLKDFENPSVALMGPLAAKKLRPIVTAAKQSQEPGPMQQIEIHATEALEHIEGVISSGEQFGKKDYEFIRSRLASLLQSMEEWISDNT